ncbi:MAG TPA: type II restriction endonuclease [Smithella sp.]|nr:type II restriction endonuclease [Smithella sp.]
MKAGHLSQYFTGVAAKRLSAVEADLFCSHQHEFNGVEALMHIFGVAHGKQKFPAKFIYLNDHDSDPVVSDGFLTWYDARENHPTRTEHRLYFPTTTVSDCAAEGDLLVIGKRPDNSILVVIAEGDSTIANQIQWLFGISDFAHPGFSVREELETEQDRIAFASRLILENIGVTIEEPTEETYLDTMLKKFGNAFPSTLQFSEYARSTLTDVDARDDQDAAIMAWMEREEILFRTLEKHLIADRLVKGFGHDVDDFIQFSLSVQNRRKSRVGYALENHLQAMFDACNIRYTRQGVTEQKSKPDFIFPGVKEYHDSDFPSLQLTMLGVKSSCKDRWRQVLAEANRIEQKHLLTLETSISTNQTEEMKSKMLQLVLPQSLHRTYTENQRIWLIDIKAFINLVREKQEKK